MIALRAKAVDNNTLSATARFCGIPVPLGVNDGDIMIAAIAVNDSTVDITPPAGWEFVGINRVEDDFNAFYITTAVYWKTALNESGHWVWDFATTHRSAGVVAVYSGVDGFEPVETIVSARTSPASGTQNYPGVIPNISDEQVLYIFSITDAGLFALVPGFTKVANARDGSNSSVAVEIQHRGAPTTAAIAAGTVNAGGGVSGAGAAFAIVLRPSNGTQSIDDVRQRLIGSFPTGVDRVYDLTSTGDYYKLFTSISHMLKVYGFDLVDTLRREVVPYLSRYVLPRWEGIFGLLTTRVARYGTLAQRQSQVLSAWRAAAGQGGSIPEVQAALAPVLGYNNAADVQIIECDRDALTALHTYPTTTTLPATAPFSADTTFQFNVIDDALVGEMGVQIFANVSHPTAENLSAVLVGPNADGSANDPSTFVHADGDGIAYKEFTAPAFGETSPPEDRILYAVAEAAGCYIRGTWSFMIVNSDGVDDATVDELSIFTEGLGRDSAGNDGLGAAAYTWGVYADPAHIGENGTAADFDAARSIIAKMKQVHTIAGLIQSISPWPDEESGVHAAIPDEAIPV